LKTIEEILQEVDDFFDKNQAKEAEKLLVESLNEAKATGKQGMCLQLLNELIGYYRQTSEKERLCEVIGESIAMAEVMGFGGTIQYATTALNAANGYRSIGELEKSQKCYQEAEDIYLRELSEDDMLLAGLFNNESLLFQELKDYKSAQEYLLKALDIVISNQAGFEIAVTYANLANTSVMAQDFDKAQEYAQKAIECFQERNLYDAHYCAALSAMGMCFFRAGRRNEAIRLFEDGMEIVEHTLGKNSQYYRLKANRDMCLKEPTSAQENSEYHTNDSLCDGDTGADKDLCDASEDERAITPKSPMWGLDRDSYDEQETADDEQSEEKPQRSIKGLELCKEFYLQYGKPMLDRKFASYRDRIVTGLFGEGSDCLGYDDEISRDHDWGPDFCILIPEELDSVIGEDLRKAYEELPDEFMGFRRIKTNQGKDRRGVTTIEAFFRKYAGLHGEDDFDLKIVPDESLCAAVSGEIFDDPEGRFTHLRNKLLEGYPEELYFLKLAQDCAMLSQTGQYNYGRMLERGDRLTADQMLSSFIGTAMRFWHHFKNVFPPHDKWLKESCRRLEGGENIVVILEQIHGSLKMENEDAQPTVEALAELLCKRFAKELYDASITSDTDPYLDHQVEELLMKASYAKHTNEELVNMIAKTEFKAFDLVKNEGGRAYCQNDWPTFSVMRKSQYMTWDRTMLLQYLYDFNREFNLGHNLITEKYGRMMESTAPEKYAEFSEQFPEIPDDKKAVIEQVVALQMNMVEEFAKEYPKVVTNARNLHTYEDNIADTSYETYLRGEISTYSDKMLQLYAGFVVRCVKEGKNIARETILNTAKLYGYKSLDDFEASI